MIQYSKVLVVALAIAALTVAGCKKEAAKAISGQEIELFAKAQDLQKQEKYDEAVSVYRQITRDFPSSKQGANSQFMVGYIYANHLKDYEQAKIELQRFIDKYGASSDSGLVAGARFEMQYLGKSIDEIPILSNLGEEGGDSAKGSGQ
jgi:outer membrane protein assembly factor BamD (BamD/ComL family)